MYIGIYIHAYIYIYSLIRSALDVRVLRNREPSELIGSVQSGRYMHMYISIYPSIYLYNINLLCISA